MQKRGESWYCQFAFGGKRYNVTAGKLRDSDVPRWKSRAEELLLALKRRTRLLPPGVSVPEFIECDGHVPTDPAITGRLETTFGELRDRYESAFSNGAIEANTLYTAGLHLDRLEETLGKRFLLNGLKTESLQSHLDRRTAKVQATTVKKEIDTFRSVFNWGKTVSLTRGDFPSAGLVYPKTDEQLPFMTWLEIERRVRTGGDPDVLWECLYLDSKQVAAALEYIRTKKAPLWVYPMMLLAAHTGARRSELVRARPEDVNLADGVITIREKKRARGVRTTRRVPLTKAAVAMLKPWLKSRPTSAFLFGYEDRPLSLQTAQKAFVRVFKKSKWNVLHGWHVLRHSFISILASRGTDQRIIDDCVGHSTESQRRRYRHLFPHVTKNAVELAFA